MSENFEDRMVTTTLTEEWADMLVDGDIRPHLDAGIEWFESNYNAVAEVRELHDYADFRGYELRAIAACDADIDVIHNALGSVVSQIDRGVLEVDE